MSASIQSIESIEQELRRLKEVTKQKKEAIEAKIAVRDSRGQGYEDLQRELRNIVNSSGFSIASKEKDLAEARAEKKATHKRLKDQADARRSAQAEKNKNIALRAYVQNGGNEEDFEAVWSEQVKKSALQAAVEAVSEG